MSSPDDEVPDGMDFPDPHERVFGMDPVARAEILRVLESELAKITKAPAKEPGAAAGPATGGSSQRPGTVSPLVLAWIPRPRPAHKLDHAHAGTGRFDRASPLEHWSVELFGLGRAVLSAAWAALAPAERDALLDQLLAARRRQREVQDRSGPVIGDSDD